MLRWGIQGWEDLLTFFETGGDVLIALFCVTFVMWAIIIERFSYLKLEYPKQANTTLSFWNQRPDKESWHSQQIQSEIVSRTRQKITQFMPLLKTLIAICPLLGLLGTVTGMIEVFDVMAIAGSGNPRAMAAGVSRATIPTMAGMVAALSGLYFSARLNRLTAKHIRTFQDQLS